LDLNKSIINRQSNQPIGVFDSGLGGLSILKALKNKLPNEQFVYFGDTAHLPYGDKSGATLKEYVSSIVSFLDQQNCKLVIVACNSAATVIHKMENLPFEEHQIVEVISPIGKLVTEKKKVSKNRSYWYQKNHWLWDVRSKVKSIKSCFGDYSKSNPSTGSYD